MQSSKTQGPHYSDTSLRAVTLHIIPNKLQFIMTYNVTDPILQVAIPNVFISSPLYDQCTTYPNLFNPEIQY